MRQLPVDEPQSSNEVRKSVLYAGIVWVISALSLTAYGVIGLFNTTIPGVEQMITFLSSVDGNYIYLGAFIAILLEGLYFIGSFFPGASLVVILAILSQLNGYFVFSITILTIFLGWSIAGAINIFATKLYRSQVFKLKDVENYDVKDRVWTTWFPAFRANYEVAQTIEGGNSLKVFISSVRVKFFVTIAIAIITLIIPFFIDINKMTNEEGFVILFTVAVISFIVGIIKIRHYYVSVDKDIIIEKSKIEGMGVFANRDFEKGEVVLKWKPKIITKEKSKVLAKNKKRYVMQINDTYYLMQAPEKYVNHSCDANTTVKDSSDVAIRNIKKGEEITSDYSDIDSIDFECKCGSENCNLAMR